MSIIFDFATCIQSGQEPTGCARNGWTINRRGLNLNVEEFFAVKQQNGLVPLFTCGCGNFDCSGYYTDVSCTDTALILRNGYHRFNRSLQAEFEYHLDWQQVRGIAEEILRLRIGAELRKTSVVRYEPG